MEGKVEGGSAGMSMNMCRKKERVPESEKAKG
jgi:hypothetical protein